MTLLLTSRAVLRRSFAPLTRLTGSEWANRHGWIARSSGAAEAGQYSTERAPYLAEILDVMCDEVHRDVVLNKPAQVGFTECLNQFVGYCMAEDPSGVIVIQPNVDMAKAWMKERIDPMLAEAVRLKGIVRSENGRRTSDDTMQRKVFPGGWLVAVGANSPSGLRSRPARRILGDERSGWTLDARQQGDPWDLAVERTATFWNAKRIQGSTPGEEGLCPITKALRQSDWREFHVACPACGFVEPFRWKTGDGTYRLVCEHDAADALIPQTARYLCTACGTLIPESEKAKMLRGGRWVARHPERSVAGFDLNGLVSPWRTWADVMDLWVKAQGNLERLKVFVTHVLAEPWKDVTERIDVHTLAARAVPMEQPPAFVGALTAAIDVQKDRLESLLIGVGVSEEVAILDWSTHEGDPTGDAPWDEAWAHLTAWRGVALAGLAIDTGFLTDTVWRHVDAWNGQKGVRVIGVKGVGGRGRPWIVKPARVIGTKQRRPWLIGTDTAKDALFLRWRTPVPPGGPGALHCSAELDHAFYEQVTAEEQKVVMTHGRPERVWRLIPGRRNEGGDLLIYALGVAYGLGAPFLASLAERAAARVPFVAPEVPVEPQVQVSPQLMMPRPGGWVSGWRR